MFVYLSVLFHFAIEYIMNIKLVLSMGNFCKVVYAALKVVLLFVQAQQHCN